MFDFYQRRKLKAFLKMPITRIGLFVLAVLMTWSAYTRYQKAEIMAGRRHETEAEVQHLREQKVVLEKQVNYLKDERGIEAEMRRQFDVALPGEQVVVIVDDKNKNNATSSQSTTTSTQEDHPWYQFWE
jgi:cell division protein FtsB